jgi:hypothetical protein
MCNGNHHYPGCMCGWGRGGRYGGRVVRLPHHALGHRDAERCRRWRNMPMSELAAELGRSILFPVDCRYCGDRIFLYANPDGGFAMFDDVGPPWPKHRCPGMPGRPEGYRLATCPLSPRYGMPVPEAIGMAEYRDGSLLKGAVVLIRQATVVRRAEAFFDIALYDGRFLFAIRTLEPLSMGAFVAGWARFTPGVGTCLEGISKLDPGLSL